MEQPTQETKPDLKVAGEELRGGLFELKRLFDLVYERFDKVDKRLDEIQVENNCWHEKTYRLQVGLEARVNSLEDRVAALEKGY